MRKTCLPAAPRPGHPWGSVPHPQVEGEGHQGHHESPQEEHPPPAQGLLEEGEGRGRHKPPRGPQAHEEGGDRGVVPGEPEAEGLHGAHQGGGHPHPDQGPAQGQNGEALRQAEDHAPQGGHEEEGRGDGPGPHPVQKPPQGELGRGEGQVEEARHEAELRRPQAQLLGEVLGEHRIHRAVEVGEEIP